MSIRALIADDEPPARDKLVRWLEEQSDFEVAGVVGDGVSVVRSVEALRPDVVFLDIQMPTMSGLEAAAQLEAASAPLLVFVTAFDEHALAAFDLNAVDYLLKPFHNERFLRSLERVRTRLRNGASGAPAVRTAREQTKSAERLLVPIGEQLRLIETRSIVWLEADDNYVRVHTSEREHLLRRTLQDLLAQLGESQFVRIHKSAAVNVAAVHALTPLFKGDHEIELKNGRRLRLSRRYKDALFALTGR